MSRRTDGLETRAQILRSAAKLFARGGFKQTTNAEISRASGVNSALINYYFGDKETIYKEAWDWSRMESLRRYPVAGDVPPEAGVVERLNGIIDSAICRYMDPECYDNDILEQEIASCTGLLDDVHEKTVFMLREELIKVVLEYCGNETPDDDVRQMVLSIVAMCIVPIKKIQNIEVQSKPYCYERSKRIEHVCFLTLAGLDALKRKNHENSFNS